MPSLDYKGGAVKVDGARVGALDGRFYDGSPGRELGVCPRCRRPFDLLFPHDDATPGCVRLAAQQRALDERLAASTKTSAPTGAANPRR
jgi:hypothetical protein